MAWDEKRSPPHNGRGPCCLNALSSEREGKSGFVAVDLMELQHKPDTVTCAIDEATVLTCVLKSRQISPEANPPWSQNPCSTPARVKSSLVQMRV